MFLASFFSRSFISEWLGEAIAFMTPFLLPLLFLAIRDICPVFKDAKKYGINEHGEISYPATQKNKTIKSDNTFIKLGLDKGKLTILDSNNVSSVSDNGIADFTIDFATDFSSSNLFCKIDANKAVAHEIININPASVRLKLDYEPKLFKVTITD